MKRLAVLLLVLALVSPLTFAKSRSSVSSSHSSSSTRTTHVRKSKTVSRVKRDSHRRIKRSASARRNFMRSHPCPATGKTSGACPGYVVDHIKPLASGGPDNPSNMQWQTKAAAKEKDKWERR
jgi:hypothetical protein